MRAAGAITGLLVLGTFVIPGTYTAKTDQSSGFPGPTVPGALSPATRDVGFATLSGRVFDEGGRPIEGAVVSLGGSGFWPPRSVQSAADGRFRWPEVPAGIYELRVSKGAWVAPPLEGLILDAGARRAFAVRLAPGWTLAGQVVDARTGAAVRHAEVTVASGALGLHTRRAASDARGRFELLGVVGDAQTLYVEADGYIVAGPLVQRRAGPPMIVRLERAARLIGEVLDDDGRPIAGAIVRAFAERSTGPLAVTDSLGVTSGPVPPITVAGTSSLAFVGQAMTHSDGTFELDNLRAGPYTVAASHDDFAPATAEPLRLTAGATRSDIRIQMWPGAELAGRVVDERGHGLEAIPVELRVTAERLPRMSVTGWDGSFSFRGVRGEATVTALPYDLPPSRTTVDIDEDALVTVELALSTTLYTLRGRVVDERGFGVSGALLTVASNDPATPVRRTAKSEADGSFSVPALPEPPFTVSAEHPAFSQTRFAEVDEVDEVLVSMSAGVTFLGEIRDEWTEEELPGVRVRLTGPTEAETQTRADGTFVLRQLPTGTYDVSLSHTDYETQTRRVVIEPPRYVDRPQELEVVRLRPGGVIEGEVVDVYGASVAGAEVAWGDPPRWSRAARTDVKGGFELRGVPEGSIWVTARHELGGEASTDAPVEVKRLQRSPGVFVRLPDQSTE